MEPLTDEQLFTEWKRNKDSLQIGKEILNRKVNAVGTKCGFCQGTNSWSGPITSCGCVEWDD